MKKVTFISAAGAAIVTKSSVSVVISTIYPHREIRLHTLEIAHYVRWCPWAQNSNPMQHRDVQKCVHWMSHCCVSQLSRSTCCWCFRLIWSHAHAHAQVKWPLAGRRLWRSFIDHGRDWRVGWMIGVLRDKPILDLTNYYFNKLIIKISLQIQLEKFANSVAK